jgi:hemolysin activation/secretion protein
VQFRGEWRGTGPLWGGLAEIEGNLVASFGELTDRNGRSEFEAFRVGADPAYIYGRIEGAWIRPLTGGWSGRVRGIGQLASGALLPTEQLGLGGYATVRGYAERILLADSGYTASAEIWTPPWAPSPGSWADALQLQGLAFLDHGRGWQEREGAESLTATGIGLRAALGAHGSARLDLGWGFENGGGAELQTGLTFSY